MIVELQATMTSLCHIAMTFMSNEIAYLRNNTMPLYRKTLPML